MLTVWGEKQRPLCDGTSRRSFLKVGALVVAGLTLAVPDTAAGAFLQ